MGYQDSQQEAERVHFLTASHFRNISRLRYLAFNRPFIKDRPPDFLEIRGIIKLPEYFISLLKICKSHIAFQ